MIGRAPALGWCAARAPRGIVRPGIDDDALVDAKPDRVGIVRIALGKIELALEQAGASARVDQPARVRGVLATVANKTDAV